MGVTPNPKPGKGQFLFVKVASSNYLTPSPIQAPTNIPSGYFCGFLWWFFSKIARNEDCSDSVILGKNGRKNRGVVSMPGGGFDGITPP